MTKRRPGHRPILTPDYEDKIPVANKITLNPHHPDYEVTILLPEPRGTEARQKTVKLLPFLKYIADFVDDEGNVKTEGMNIDLFVDLVEKLWGQDKFEEELLPFALGLDRSKDDEREILETLTLMGAFQSFVRGFNYLMSGSDSEEFQEAQKKSSGGGGEEEADEAG